MPHHDTGALMQPDTAQHVFLYPSIHASADPTKGDWTVVVDSPLFTPGTASMQTSYSPLPGHHDVIQPPIASQAQAILQKPWQPGHSKNDSGTVISLRVEQAVLATPRSASRTVHFEHHEHTHGTTQQVYISQPPPTQNQAAQTENHRLSRARTAAPPPPLNLKTDAQRRQDEQQDRRSAARPAEDAEIQQYLYYPPRFRAHRPATRVDYRALISPSRFIRSKWGGYWWVFEEDAGWTLQRTMALPIGVQEKHELTCAGAVGGDRKPMLYGPRRPAGLQSALPMKEQMRRLKEEETYRPLKNACPRDHLLLEWYVEEDREWYLVDMLGCLSAFARDSKATYALLEIFPVASTHTKNKAVRELAHAVADLATDEAGAKCLQRLLQMTTDEETELLAQEIARNAQMLAHDQHGHRVMLYVLHNSTPTIRELIVDALLPNALAYVCSEYGHVVLEKAITSVPPAKIDIMPQLEAHLEEIATCMHGTRLLQRCLRVLPENQTKDAVQKLVEMSAKLARDPSGNFAIQFVLDSSSKKAGAEIVKRLQGQLLRMSEDKFASNVVERALQRVDYSTRCMIVEELMGGMNMDKGIAQVKTLIMDEFGNFVIQRAVRNMFGDHLRVLLAKCRAALSEFRSGTPIFRPPRYIACVERTVAFREAELLRTALPVCTRQPIPSTLSHSRSAAELRRKPSLQNKASSSSLDGSFTFDRTW